MLEESTGPLDDHEYRIKADSTGTLRALKQQFYDHINQTFALIPQGKYYEAVQALKRANVLAGGGKIQIDQVKEASAQLQKIGESWVDEYRRQYEQGNYLEAIKGLGLTQRTFDPLPASLAAARLLEHARYDYKAQTALHEAKAQEMLSDVDDIIDCRQCSYVPAATEPASAPASRPGTNPATGPFRLAAPAGPGVRKYIMKSRLDHIRELSPDKAIRVVAILEHMTDLYQLAPTSAACYADLQTLRKDEAFWETLEYHKARQEAIGMLNAADMFARNGMTAKAIEYYRKISAKFPGTPQDKKAKEALARLK